MKKIIKNKKKRKNRKNRKVLISFFCSLIVLAVLSVAFIIKLNIKHSSNEIDIVEPLCETAKREESKTQNERIERQQGQEKAEKPLYLEEKIMEQEQDLEMQVEENLNRMSIEEKVAQLFIVTPESLTGVKNVIAAGETTKKMFEQYPVGGFVYFENNLQSSEQVISMLSNVQKYSMECIKLPVFTCVDEEGGTVTRISKKGKFNVPDIGDMSMVGQSGDVQEAYTVGNEIGKYLSELGFNIDFAPVADVLSNPNNQVVKMRSFGSNPDLTADMSMSVCQGIQEHNICAVLKHYPGHGATEEDSHQGYAYTMKSLEELQQCELVPFQRGIDENISFIMAGHISVPNVTGDNTPSTLSKKMISEILRGQMGYQGIVITDGMNMRAITQNYSSAEAAVNALLAGVDIILMPENFQAAYYGVLEAVNHGRLTEDRIDESVKRILLVKLRFIS